MFVSFFLFSFFLVGVGFIVSIIKVKRAGSGTRLLV